MKKLSREVNIGETVIVISKKSGKAIIYSPSLHQEKISVVPNTDIGFLTRYCEDNGFPLKIKTIEFDDDLLSVLLKPSEVLDVKYGGIEIRERLIRMAEGDRAAKYDLEIKEIKKNRNYFKEKIKAVGINQIQKSDIDKIKKIEEVPQIKITEVPDLHKNSEKRIEKHYIRPNEEEIEDEIEK